METRANYVAVGIFTFLAIIAAFALVYWTSGMSNRDTLVPLQVRIEGSVSGLGPGSVVQFNGITVGRVEDLSLDTSNPRYVVVHTKIDGNTPVRQDTKASVGLRGLSGGAFIALEGGTPDAPALLSAEQELVDGRVPQIIGDPSAISDLIVRVNTIANQVETTMTALNSFVHTNQQSLSNTFASVETFSAALAENSDDVSQFMDSAGQVAEALQGLSGKIDATVSQLEQVVEAVEPEKVAAAVENVNAITRRVRTVVDGVDQGTVNEILADLRTTSKRLAALTEGVETTQITALVDDLSATVAKTRDIVSGVDGAKVASAVDDVSAVASGARGIVDTLDQNVLRQLVADVSRATSSISAVTDAIDANGVNRAVTSITEAAEGAQQVVADVRGVTSGLADRGPDVQRVVDSAVELSERLNETSKKLDGVVEQAQSLLGSDQTNGVMNDVQNTLAEFRKTSQVIAAEIARISGNVDGVARRGLGDTQTLIRDARRSIDRIDRVIRNIENNPSSLISGAGGSRIRETGGSRPRR